MQYRELGRSGLKVSALGFPNATDAQLRRCRSHFITRNSGWNPVNLPALRISSTMMSFIGFSARSRDLRPSVRFWGTATKKQPESPYARQRDRGVLVQAPPAFVINISWKHAQ
ncbi:hypothetical protein [Rhizobium jaguaris]|uniref:hypothetical protein n=1 Tax=Rhizobium jaguaris TaxID=1312183 RepID=UPI0013C4DFA5|nr:hypothetical protein [Rhizobium jaguaris]